MTDTPKPTDAELNSLAAIALHAAYADGERDERERAHLREIAAKIAGDRIDPAALDRVTLSGPPPFAEMVKPLSTPAIRRYAYEIAVSVAAADGVHSESEAAYLRSLASALGLPATDAAKVAADANAIAAAPAGAAAAPTGRASPDPAALDRTIVNAAVTNAALELLPETLASMAILPLQARLVYRIGQAHGYELDQGHIKEFVATLGVGLAGQYLEQFGRKMLGGLLGSVLGGLGRSIGRQTASSGMAFATTWAIGQVAKQYYGGGRTLDAAKLKAAFAPLLEQGQTLVQRYGGEIAERARSIDLKDLPSLVKSI
ncbi:MAG: DUF533 domain-containing protein [Burkholderiales bacterium]|nr:DUF533 domain-containing protein [Burkholderiales bacterium]MCE7876989.1 DUF533 domain-containing protein [Betaproteobacteria bacterium PRO3]